MRVAALLLTLSTALVPLARASTITEYSRATFQTALAGDALSVQNFDSLPLGPITTVNGVTYHPSLGTALVTNSFLTTTPPNGLGSTSVGFFETGETLTITFNAPITAFALDINTFATATDSYTATVNDGSNSVIDSLFDVFPGSTTGQFIGFTDSDPFTSVVIAANQADAFSYTVDTLVYGDAGALVATPEPSSLILFGSGLVGAIAMARRKIQSA